MRNRLRTAMRDTAMDPQLQPIHYAYIALVAVLVFGLRMWRMRRPQRLRLETLWASPAVLLLILGVALYQYPPLRPIGWAWPPLAALIGAIPGWHRGKHMRITVDPVTHKLNQQGSPRALLFILVVLLARQIFRFEARRLGIDLLDVGSWLLAFAFGFVAATRAEMFLRARRLLAEARAV